MTSESSPVLGRPSASLVPGFRARRSGFTLVELLVVMLIIIILVSILIPVASKIRKAGYDTSSRALMASLVTAIEEYKLDYGAYPGPLTDDQIRGPAVGFQFKAATGFVTPSNISTCFDNRVTSTENLVLGLCGGLTFDPVKGILFDPGIIGSGPRSLNPAITKSGRSYIDTADVLFQDQGTGKTGVYFDGGWPTRATVTGTGIDSPIPEFVDRYPQGQQMPILYLRARQGATGNIATGVGNINGISNDPGVKGGQYDLDQVVGYTGAVDDAGALIPAAALGTAASQHNIGPRTLAPTAYLNDGVPVVIFGDGAKYHGLQFAGANAAGGTGDKFSTLRGTNNGSYNPLRGVLYFTDPQMTGRPRAKDTYILILAGPDRTYGTADDITTFGQVAP